MSTTKKMELLDLPLEIFQRVLETTVVENGLDQAMGMRLVSKLFEHETIRAICITRALDRSYSGYMDRGVRYQSVRLLSEYIFTRTVADHALVYHFSRVICPVMDFILKERPEYVPRKLEFMRALCVAAMKLPIRSRQHERYISIREILDTDSAKLYQNLHEKEPSLEEKVLAAAMYLDMPSLARGLITSGVDDLVETYFGRAYHNAISRADMKMIHAILDSRPDQPKPFVEAWEGTIEIFKLVWQPGSLHSIYTREPDTFYLEAVRAAASAGNLEGTEWIIQEATLSNVKIIQYESAHLHQNILLKYDESDDLGEAASWWDVALWEAAYHGKEDIVKVSLGHGADPNVYLDHGTHNVSTALDVASLGGYEGVVRLLLAYGALTNPFAEDDSVCCFMWPLKWAMRLGWLRIAQLLIDHGAAVNPHSWYWTHHMNMPLVAAAFNGQLDSVVLLLENGAKLVLYAPQNFLKRDNIIRGDIGSTAYDRARSSGYTSVMRVLEEHGFQSKEGEQG